MPYVLRLAIVLAVFIVFTTLFYFAAGTLSPRKMNLINISYYCYVVMAYMGASLVFLGYREHYLMAKINTISIFDQGYGYVALLGILFPLTILLANQLFHPLFGTRSMEAYRALPMHNEKKADNLQFFVFCFAFFLCAGVTALFYWRVKQVPIVPWLTGTITGEMRQILGRSTVISPYLKSFFMIQFPAYFSFFAYIKMRTLKTLRWTLLFGAYFLLAVITKTYDFQKAPILIYLMLFALVEMTCHPMRLITVLLVLIAVVLAMVGMYVLVFHFEGRILSPYNGPQGRLFFTQIAGFFHTLQIFPAQHGFLQGESLPTFITALLDLPVSWNRSAAIVMRYVSPDNVLRRTAGVMNTFFIGEAYANWGKWGLILGTIYVGVLYSFVQSLFLGARKTALTVTLYVIIVWNFTISFIGGFIDYIYSSNLLVLLVLYGILQRMSAIHPQKMQPIGRQSWIKE